MSLFSLYVPAEYFNATHDIMRMACIQIVVQFLFSVVNADENPFFSVMFLQTIAFVLIGVAFYWLVLRYVVRVHTDTSAKPDDAYSPATHTLSATKATKTTKETYESTHELPEHTINTTTDYTTHTNTNEKEEQAKQDMQPNPSINN